MLTNLLHEVLLRGVEAPAAGHPRLILAEAGLRVEDGGYLAAEQPRRPVPQTRVEQRTVRGVRQPAEQSALYRNK